jgi:hypothetical protein
MLMLQKIFIIFILAIKEMKCVSILIFFFLILKGGVLLFKFFAYVVSFWKSIFIAMNDGSYKFNSYWWFLTAAVIQKQYILVKIYEDEKIIGPHLCLGVSAPIAFVHRL